MNPDGSLLVNVARSVIHLPYAHIFREGGRQVFLQLYGSLNARDITPITQKTIPPAGWTDGWCCRCRSSFALWLRTDICRPFSRNRHAIKYVHDDHLCAAGIVCSNVHAHERHVLSCACVCLPMRTNIIHFIRKPRRFSFVGACSCARCCSQRAIHNASYVYI